MTVTVQTPISGPYVADGVTYEWAYSFKVIDEDHLMLEITTPDEDPIFVTTGFTATGVGDDDGGVVTYPIDPIAPLVAGTSVRVVRNVPYEQPVAIGTQGAFLPEVHENAFDNLAMQIQQLASGGLGADLGALVSEAEAHAAAAEVSAAAALTSEQLGFDWADLAERYATEAEDVEVEPGKYSAFHWSQKAEDAGLGIVNATAVVVTPAGDIESTNVQDALVELDNEKAPLSHGHTQGEIVSLMADLALKAPLASPAFTGNPTAPTPATVDEDTSIATTAWGWAAIDTLAVVYEPINANLLKRNVTAVLTVGYTATAVDINTTGKIASPHAPNPATHQKQFGTNNLAIQFNALTADGDVSLLITNGATAGAVTFSGYTVGAGKVGDAFTTTNGHKFLVQFSRINGVSMYHVKALQ